MGDKLKLCLGCMEPKADDGICPNCGYANNNPYLPSYIAPGSILNERYLVGKLLSYNGEGATYIAYDVVTNKKMLIREYMPDALCTRVRGSSIICVNQQNLVQYKNFMAEFTELNKTLSKMRTLNHINPALDLFAENNTTYVVFDYIDGITLKQYLQENAGELSWDEVKKLFPPIFTTLSLVHNAGIVHKGISLETIFITSRGELKLTGFCITASRTANTEIASELYAGYAAPEQYSSSNWQGTWTDVYAISAILYRILTGCMPTEAISRIGSDSLCEPAMINPNIPQNISKVIMSGLKLSGDMRIQTVTELVTKLFEQPDYLDQSNNTHTVLIQKQQIKSVAASQSKKPLNNKKNNSKLDMIRIPLIVFVSMLVILGLAAIISVFFANSNKNSDDSTAMEQTSISSESSNDITLAVGNTMETTTKSASSADSNGLSKDYVMPSFLNKNFESIKNSDTYKDLLIFIAEYEYNEEFEKGTIFNQSINENEAFAKGTEVKLKVSLGSKFVAVPDYYGLTEKDYTAKLDAAGIKYDKIKQKDSGFLTGYVINTNKQAGENIDVSIGEVLTVYICDNSDTSSYSNSDLYQQ